MVPMELTKVNKNSNHQLPMEADERFVAEP